jgi:uncharacterized protein (UPF0332 family)
VLLRNGHLHDTVNRLYYSCFYIVSALLLCEGHSSSKHGGIVALFDRQWVKTGRVPVTMGRFYRHLFDFRQRGDCVDLVKFEAADVAEWHREAKGFVTTLTAQVRKLLTELEDSPGASS